MDLELDQNYREVQEYISKEHGELLDMKAIIFLIGVQELGQGFVKLKKSEKMDVMHIAMCRLMEPYGYYSYQGVDKDNWPHFERLKALPNLESREQEVLLKQAIVDYFLKE